MLMGIMNNVKTRIYSGGETALVQQYSSEISSPEPLSLPWLFSRQAPHPMALRLQIISPSTDTYNPQTTTLNPPHTPKFHITTTKLNPIPPHPPKNHSVLNTQVTSKIGKLLPAIYAKFRGEDFHRTSIEIHSHLKIQHLSPDMHDNFICMTQTGKFQANWVILEVTQDNEQLIFHVKMKVMRLS